MGRTRALSHHQFGLPSPSQSWSGSYSSSGSSFAPVTSYQGNESGIRNHPSSDGSFVPVDDQQSSCSAPCFFRPDPLGGLHQNHYQSSQLAGGGRTPENHPNQQPGVRLGNGVAPHYRVPLTATAASYHPAPSSQYWEHRQRALSADGHRSNHRQWDATGPMGCVAPQSLVPRKFQKIVLLDEKLGTGSYGAVFKAKCEDTFTCAAKVIHQVLLTARPKPGSPLGRFGQECEMLSSLRHPNVVQYFGTHVNADGNLLLLMELMDESLTSFLEKSQMPLPFRTQVDICHAISLALSFLHSNGILHRDLSSNNVLMIGDRRAKVTDFGMAKWQDHSMPATRNTTCPGTNVYMPPEALDGDVAVYDKSIDCFSLGVLAIQILTGIFPHPGARLRRTVSSLDPNKMELEEVSEADRRKDDIETVYPEHPILRLALLCLNSNPRFRPAAKTMSVDFERLTKVREYHASVRASTSSHPARALSAVSELERELSARREELERTRKEKSAQEAETLELLEARDREIAFLLSRVDRQEDTQRELAGLQQEVAKLQRELGEKEQLVGVEKELRLQLEAETTKLKNTQQILADTLQSQTEKQAASLQSHMARQVIDVPSSFPIRVHTVQLRKSSSLTLDLPNVVTANLKSLAMRDKSVSADVTSTYEVSFTPEVRGRHRLDVSVNGKNADSYEVFVDEPMDKIPETPTRVVLCPSTLTSFCVSNRLIYYADNPHQKYHVLEVSTDVSSKQHLQTVWCKRGIKRIAVDADGFVYFTSDHQLHRFSPEGEKLAIVGEDDSGSCNSRLCDPQGLAVEPQKKQIHVCDTGNGRVMVFNTNLNFVGKYGEGIITKIKVPKSGDKPGHLRAPLDIAFSSSCTAYVMDDEKKAIVVFKNMVYDSNFSLDKLATPTSLCFRQKHLLVADWAGCCLGVFDRVQDRWQLVRRMEVQGSPVGVCTDPDGFIYVAESTNNTVTLY